MKRISYREPGFLERLGQLNRSYERRTEVVQSVRQIIAQVREKGDRALVEISNRFGSEPITVAGLKLTAKPKNPPAPVKQALLKSLRNVEKFHKKHLPKSWRGRNNEGGSVGERYEPLGRVGIYVPGGTAPLVSTALMTVTLARVAGVREIVVCTPGPVNPVMHYAICLAGATEIYQVGGAQAIAALAYGTETIKPVNKVYGPGNSYVVEAKRQVFGMIGVDLLPGPSEVAVLADKTCKPAYVAADLLAQAEHGPRSQIFLVSPEKKILDAVAAEIEVQIDTLERQTYLRETLNLGCYLVEVKSLKEGVELIESIAPEHLSLACAGSRKLAQTVRNCGAIYVGDYSPVAMGDYAAGPSHELPTAGAAKAFSGLTIDQFFRRTSVVEYSAPALSKGRKTVECLAAVEGMGAHARSVSIRFDKKKKR